MERHIILGAGIAGRRAAEVIKEKDPGVEIVMVEEEQDPFYYRPMLGEFVARGLTPEQIYTKDKARFSRLGVSVITGLKVTSLNPEGQEVTLSNGERMKFDKLLIASGRRTARVSGVSDEVTGVTCLDTLTDAVETASLLGSVHRAVVFGSSIQALNAVRGLRGCGVDCTLLIPEDRFWPGVLDAVASEILEDRLKKERVTLLKTASVREFKVEEGRLKGILTPQGEEIPADLFVAAAPQVPLLDYVEGGDLANEQGIPVDETMRTQYEDIFAAGDVAQPPDATSNRRVPQPGWLNAWIQGRVAGVNMAGGSTVYKGIPSLRTKALDLDVVCLGLSDAQGQGVREDSGQYPYEEMPYIYKKIVYKDQQVAGAIFLGDVSEAGHVEQWIRKGLKADQCTKDVLDQMFQPRIREFTALGALCPVCKFQIQVENTFEEGAVVTCPACGVEFRLQRMPNGVFRADPAGRS